MRAGAFSEKRVIDLLNRRFVNFYYNRSGAGEGGDAAASKFVTGKTRNKYAFFAAFDSNGKWLGETDLYADKDKVFDFLLNLTKQYPALSRPTDEEKGTLALTKSESRKQRHEAARLMEELGRYDEALASYSALGSSDDLIGKEAKLASIRIYRYRKDWKKHKQAEAALTKSSVGMSSKETRLELTVEQGYRLVAEKKYPQALELLRPLCFTAQKSIRIAEVHFLCGVANWFLESRNWAKFHFCWVVERTPESHISRRAYIAAVAEAMPYKNPALGNYAAPVGNIGPHNILRGYADAKIVYEALLVKFRAKDWSSAAPPTRKVAGGHFMLVSQLVDGNSHRVNNNKIVKKLESIGKATLPSLMAAIEDTEFPGRGYAAWALSQVLKSNKIVDKAALQVLKDATEDRNGYVSALARSGLGTLE